MMNAAQICWNMFDGELTGTYRDFGTLLHVLQERYVQCASEYLYGREDGCAEALWLAEMYPAQLLVLECRSGSIGGRRLQRLCSRNLFTLVCPVILIGTCDQLPPELSKMISCNVKTAEYLPHAIHFLNCGKRESRENIT